MIGLRTVAILVVAVSVAIVGCVQEQVPRDSSTATPAQTPTPTPTAALAQTPSPTVPESLFLDVRGPADGTVVDNAAVVVHGLTLPGATVTIGSRSEVAGPDGQFLAEVPLVSGENTIDVVATDSRTASQISARLTVVFKEPPGQPFFLVVTEPEDQSIVSTSRLTVAGRTSPEAVVTVNGVGVAVDDAGTFSTVIALDEGPNIIEVVGSGPQGRVLSAVIAVIYRP